MNAPQGLKTVAGSALILILLVTTGCLSLEQRNRENQARDWVVHTFTVIDQLHIVRATVKDAQIAEQDYLLSGKQEYLQLFRETEPKIKHLIEVLRGLTIDNPDQQRRLDSLSVKVEEKLSQLKETIDLANSKKPMQAFALVRSDLGTKLLDDVRHIIAELIGSESRLLDARTKTLDDQVKRTETTLHALILLAMLMSALIGRFLVTRQKTLMQLEKNEKQLSDFFENAVVALQWVGADGRILRVNKAECTMLGYLPQELIGHQIEEFHADRRTIEEILARLKSHEELHDYEARLRCKDGAIKTVLIDSNVQFENGEFVHTRCFTRDITLQKKAESELRQSEARNRALIETAPDAILTFTSEGTIESVNKATASLFGLHQEEIVGHNLSRFIPDFFSEKHSQLHPITTGQSKVFGVGREMFALGKDGVLVPIELAWNVLNLGDRTIFTAIVRDISERKAVESRLALQYAIAEMLTVTGSVEDLTKRILEITAEYLPWSTGAVWIVNQAKNLLECVDLWSLSRLRESKFLCETVNTTFALGVGLPGGVWQSGQPQWIEDVSKEANFLRASSAIETGLRAAFAFPIFSEGEVIGACEFFAEEARPPDPQLLQTMLAIGNQIGQVIARRNATALIQQSEDRFRQMAENIKEIFWITDKRGAVPVYVSPAYEQIFGRSVASLFENPHQFFQSTHEDDRDRLADTIRRQSKSDRPCEIEYRIRRPNGEIRWLWARLSSIVDKNGVVGLCGVTNDITERKAAETRVNEFYSTVSHELRTPLTSIRGSLGLMEGGKTGELPPKAMQLVKIGRAECDRLIRLINDILDIKKIEAGHLDLEKASIDPSTLVARTLDAISGMATESGVALASYINSKQRIYGDFERLMQVLTNLVSNAIKFSPQMSEILVTVEDQPNNMLRFAVKDHGCGIPADQMHKLFAMFQQLDSSDSRSKGGTGLGLAISKSIVEQHEGAIGVESQVGDGSVFWFDVPIDKASQTDEIRKDGGSCLRVQIDEQLHHPRPANVLIVLIVEDDSATLEVLRQQIGALGVNCLEAVDGEQALAIARTENIDLIILDVGLPLLDGFEVVAGLRQEKGAKIPLIVYTNRDLSRDEKKNLSLGPTAHLVKSRTTDAELIACVKDLLNGVVEHKTEGK